MIKKTQEDEKKLKYKHVSCDDLHKKRQSQSKIQENLPSPLEMSCDKSIFNNFHMCHGEPAINNVDDLMSMSTTKIYYADLNFENRNKFPSQDQKRNVNHTRSNFDNIPSSYNTKIIVSDNYLKIPESNGSPRPSSTTSSISKAIELPKKLNKHPSKTNKKIEPNQESVKFHYFKPYSFTNQTPNYINEKDCYPNNKQKDVKKEETENTENLPSESSKNLFSSSSVLNGYYLRDSSSYQNDIKKFKETIIKPETEIKNHQTSESKPIKFSDQFLTSMLNFLKSTAGMTQIAQNKTLQREPSPMKLEQQNLTLQEKNAKRENSLKLLETRLQEAKKKMPATSPIQLFSEICGKDSHIIEILRKTTPSSNKLKYSDPRFRTFRKISSNALDQDKFSEETLGSSSLDDRYNKQLGSEYSTISSSESYSSNSMNGETSFQCESEHLNYLRRQIYQSLPIKTNVEYQDLLSNIENYINTIQIQFLDLEYSINNLKDDMTRLIYQSKFTSDIEKPLINNLGDYETLHKQLSNIHCGNCNEESKLNFVKACLGSGITLSVIFIMFEVMIHNYFR